MRQPPFSSPSHRQLTTPRYYQPGRTTYTRQSIPPRQKRPTGQLHWVIVLVCLACLIAAGGLFLPMAFAKQKMPSRVLDHTLASNLTKIINQNSQYRIGVVLNDLTSGTTVTFGQNTPFVAASTSKVLVACAYYHLVETGQAALTDTLGAYPAQFQIQEMVNDSSNDSWHLLTTAIGDNRLQAYAQSIGIDYDIGTNSLTPMAMATLLSKLYKGTLLNHADTTQLLGYMQQTNDEELIPAALPSDVTVYHKYGELDGELHDASIIVKNGHAYAFVIYTQRQDDDTTPDNRVTLIHQLTQTTIAALFR